MVDKAEILIIGAGVAGLTAAYQILKYNPDKKVCIIEKTDFIGGLSASKKVDGNTYDFGPHRYHSTDPNVLNFFDEILPTQGSPSIDDSELSRNIDLSKNGPDPNVDDNVMLNRNRISRIYFDGKFFDYPIKLNLKTLNNMGIKNSIVVLASYLKAVFNKKEENNLENLYINKFGKKLYEMFFEYYTENLWGRHPREIDASWGHERVAGVSIKKIIINALSKSKTTEKSFVDKFKYPKLGSGQFWEVTANKIQKMGGQIITGVSVIKINTSANQVNEAILSDNSVIKTNHIISTMPLKNLINAFDDVPKNVVATANALPYRDYMLATILVDKLAIKNTTKLNTINNQIPDVWIYIQDRSVKLGRIVVFNNFSPYMLKDYKNTVWIGLEYFVSENDKYWNMTEKDFLKLAISEIKKIGVISNDTNIFLSHVEKYKKAYPAYFDGYYDIDVINNYIKTIKGLKCIGRNGKHQYNNIDDSILDAFKVAKTYTNSN